MVINDSNDSNHSSKLKVLCEVSARQAISLACLFIWETQTKLSVFVCVFHADRQANERARLTKTSH